MIPTFEGALALLMMAVASAAAGQSSPAAAVDDTPTILFVGNSLTYANDLPALVRGRAATRGRDVRTRMIAHPNYSLEDHWRAGVADSIRRIRADYVVMQQGPSSLPESGAQLLEWTDSLARVTREAGGEPVVLMVWPPLERAFAWDAVRDNYAAAARASSALLAPAGEAIRARHAAHPSSPLFDGDGFHPRREGSLIVAETIADVLFGADPPTP